MYRVGVGVTFGRDDWQLNVCSSTNLGINELSRMETVLPLEGK